MAVLIFVLQNGDVTRSEVIVRESFIQPNFKYLLGPNIRLKPFNLMLKKCYK
jgi:hypothetical protein